MYCWGSSENGELGIGDAEVENVLLPAFNNFGLSLKIKQIASGLTHTLFLNEEGQVFSCGNNDAGQLGHNKATRKPEHIDALAGYTITQVSAGDQHSLALTSWGTVYSWGENGFGQLGINSSESHSDVPRLAKTLTQKKIVQVSCGANHTITLTHDNEIYAWGHNSNGQLGLGHMTSPMTEPCCIKLLSSVPWRLIKAGGQHSTALSKAGFMFTWGSNKYGQLGRPTEESTACCSTPKLVPNLATYSEPLRYVAAGENHTAVLDLHGKLWTFGHGRYGQLGHGAFGDSSVPRPVLDLVGSRVTQVACGRGHTLVCVPSQVQLYSFGQGMSGQLGVKCPQNSNVPQAVIGPWRDAARPAMSSEEGLNVDLESSFYKIYAGGDANFALGWSTVDLCASRSVFPSSLVLEAKSVDAMVALTDGDVIDDDLFTYCETVLGSLGCWNGSFVKEGTSKVDHCLDYPLLEDCMSKLGRLSKEALRDITHSGIARATSALPSAPLTPEALRGYVTLPLWKSFSDLRHALSFQRPFADALLSLSVTASVTYKRWLQTLPLDYLRRLVSQYKAVVAHIIRSQKHAPPSAAYQPLTHSFEEEKQFLLSSLKVLDLFYKENKFSLGRKFRLPYEEFYIPDITENVDIRKDYFNWLLHSTRSFGQMDHVCFCEYSFLFDSQAKTLLLRVDATKQMHSAINEAVQHCQPWHMILNPQEVQFLTLHVRRTHLVADTLSHILRHPYNELKKPLKVHFIDEEAEDAGGVRKEFFLLVLRELLNPDYGMFLENRDSNTIWFSEAALEADDMYALIAIVCGLAIYNSTIVNLPFPIALYKKLLDEPVGIDDLAEMDPVFCKSLRALLAYDGSDVEDVFCLNFTVTQEIFGETKDIPLKPSGKTIAVNADNKQEYVDLLVDWRLSKSTEKQYRAFHDGFHRVCGGGVLKLFQPLELMALVTGNENYDWAQFRGNTIYKGEYYPDHPTIELFWIAFDELTHEQKKKFLMFLTGCDRIPILGMKVIQMTIESTSDQSFLPVAHTCVSQLDLPVYGTIEKLKYKLIQAIQQSEGFGLV